MEDFVLGRLLHMRGGAGRVAAALGGLNGGFCSHVPFVYTRGAEGGVAAASAEVEEGAWMEWRTLFSGPFCIHEEKEGVAAAFGGGKGHSEICHNAQEWMNRLVDR